MIYPQQQNQQSIHLMSKLSNIQSQNNSPPISHRNEPHTTPIAHSQHPNPLPFSGGQKQWIATYIDGQYFLTDPESMNKLKNIQAQIEQQRNRLAKLEHENTSNNNSFLSYQDEAQERQSNRSVCDTEFNQSRHFNKQEKVKVQLEKEEEMYREKLKNTQRQKLELKKNVKQVQQPIKQEEQNKPSPSHKSSQKNQPFEQQNKSKKPTQQEVKDKSYHKSRIEKSIKDNIVLHQEKVESPQKSVKVQNEQENASAVKSVKVVGQGENQLQVEGSARKEVGASSKKEQIGSSKKDPSAKQESNVSKSIKIVVLQPNGHQLDVDKQSTTKQEPEKSLKAEISPQKSVKVEAKSIKLQQKSVKASQKSMKNDLKSVKIESLNVEQKSVKAALSVKNDQKSKKASQKSMKIQENPKSVIQQENEKSAKIQNQKSICNSNFDKKSLKPSENLQNSPNKSQKSHQLQHQGLQVQQPNHSQRKSIKKSQKLSNYEKAPSQRPQSIKVSQKPTPSVKMVQFTHENRSQKQEKISQKAPSLLSQKLEAVNESPTKSVKRSSVKASSKSKPLTDQIQQPPKSIKSKINEPIESYEEVQQKSIKSVPQNNLLQGPEEEVKSRRSNLIEEIKSKKSSNQIDQQIKSKRSNLIPAKIEEIDTKSKKSYQAQITPSSHQLQAKSIKQQEDIVSKKSSFKNQQPTASVKEEIIAKESIQEIKSKKSAKIENNSEVLSKKSNKEEFLSKKSSKQSPQKSRQIPNSQEIPIIKNEQPSIKQNSPSQKHSFTKKESPVPLPLQAKQTVKQVNVVDQSIQYSRITQQKPVKFQPEPHSEKNSSFIIQNNDVSMNQSSQLKLQMLQNELKPEVKDTVPAQYNMKKKKQEILENHSDKKSKSFVIHSRQGSVKDRSQKHYEKLNNSKVSSPSRKSKDNSAFNQSSVINQSITKEEISKLHQQILLLQEKLKKVEDRQELLQKFQGTISKIHQIQQPVRREEQPEQSSRVKPETPMIQNLAELSIAIKAQPRLQIQSSILQVNTTDDIKKKQEKEVENNEKTKLKDQIGRLKRIIRDMQIEKIKSIDHEEGESPTLKPRNFDGKESREIDRHSRVQRESINSFEGISGQRRFGSNNKRLLEDAGKIMHNTSYLDKPIETPKRRSIHKMKLVGSSEDEIITDPIQLPTNSTNAKKNKFYSEVRKSELVNKLGEKEREFHNFIESSRVIAEENSNNKADPIEPVVTPFKNFSRIAIAQDSGASKINYSRMVEQMKKNNPQEEEVLPEIHMRDLKMPNLPPVPHANLTQEELLALAKATYLVFGINVDEEDKQLCVKKYKNCVIFTLNNQNHQCILWHFSGKFYMGGWRTGEPGQGQKDGQGLEYIPEKHLYKGQFLNGKKNGTGILKLSNGNIYDGQWIDGIKNGRGVYLDSATKVIYSGEWRDGKKEGQGFLKLSEKEYYYGTFIKSIKQGYGVQIFVNGDKYKGEYKNGKFHGKGKYLWANGSCYQGQFTQGVRHGQGSWKSAKINGDIYIGTYEGDKKNGYGRYVWANGCMYQGGFSQDVKHGKGRLTYQDGKEIKGVWEQGNLMSTQAEKPIQHEDQPLRRSVKVASFGYPNSSKRI